MLRITRTNPTGACEILVIEGRLVGGWVVECRQHASAALADSPRVILDLSHLTYADRDGLDLLVSLASASAELRGASPFLRRLLNGARS